MDSFLDIVTTKRDSIIPQIQHAYWFNSRNFTLDIYVLCKSGMDIWRRWIDMVLTNSSCQHVTNTRTHKGLVFFSYLKYFCFSQRWDDNVLWKFTRSDGPIYVHFLREGGLVSMTSGSLGLTVGWSITARSQSRSGGQGVICRPKLSFSGWMSLWLDGNQSRPQEQA